MKRLAADDINALRSIMKRHRSRLRSYISRSIWDNAEVNELIEEVFIRVYQHRRRFRFESKLSTWLHVVTTNLIREYWRKQRMRTLVPLPEDSNGGNQGLKDPLEDNQPGHAFIDTKPLPYEVIQLKERFTAMFEAIGTLPEKLRQTFILFELKNKSQEEIARQLNCSRKTVEMRLYHAREQLRPKFRILRETF